MTSPKKPAPGKQPWHKGRAPVSGDAGESAVLQARVGSARLAKYKALGGAPWLRTLLDSLPMPEGEADLQVRVQPTRSDT